MIRFFEQSLDRIAIGLATASVKCGWKRPGQLERAQEIVSNPAYLRPNVAPAQLNFTAPTRFTFNSPIRAELANGRFRPAGQDWKKRPAVILLHGWNGELGYYWSFPFLGMALARSGINSITYELPFHAERRPRGEGQIHNLISDDLVTMVEGIHQCLADACALRLWLLEQGCPSVSVWGYSLGGWLAGLLATQPGAFAAAILQNPVARMDLAMATLPFAEPYRVATREKAWPIERLNLTNLAPAVRRTLILAGRNDLFIPLETLEDLATKWKADLINMPHGHISICWGVFTLLRAVRWLKKELQSHGH